MFIGYPFVVFSRRVAPNSDAGGWTGHHDRPSAQWTAQQVGGRAFRVVLVDADHEGEGGNVRLEPLPRYEEDTNEEDPLETVAEGLNAIADNAAHWSPEGIGRHALALQGVLREYVEDASRRR